MTDRSLERLDQALTLAAVQFTMEAQVALSDEQKNLAVERAAHDIRRRARQAWEKGFASEVVTRLAAAIDHPQYEGNDPQRWHQFVDDLRVEAERWPEPPPDLIPLGGSRRATAIVVGTVIAALAGVAWLAIRAGGSSDSATADIGSGEESRNIEDTAAADTGETGIITDSTFRNSCNSGDIERAVQEAIGSALLDWTHISGVNEAQATRDGVQCQVEAEREVNANFEQLVLIQVSRLSGRSPTTSQIESELVSMEASSDRISTGQGGDISVEFYSLADRAAEVRYYVSAADSHLKVTIRVGPTLDASMYEELHEVANSVLVALS